MERLTQTIKASAGYELLDSGREEKLERFGSVTLARPDPQCLWEKRMSENEWRKADGRYLRVGREGEWKVSPNFPKEWRIEYGGLQFLLRATSFKHTGLFPEQLSNWEWMKGKIHAAGRSVSVLNLFAYTGGATLAAAQVGASVVHLDASKGAVAWARENAAASNLTDKPIRWVTEDALTFVRREIKRGNSYDAIVMDPPAFGHGPNNELWKIEEDLLDLMSLCQGLLSNKPLFFLMSGYAAGYSPFAFAYNLGWLEERFGGTVECGDFTIEEKNGGRLLPCGIFGRWSKS